MADTGWLNATTYSITAAGDDQLWADEENALTDDGFYATISVGSFLIGDQLHLTGFGASIAADSIDGVEVEVRHLTNTNSGSVPIYLTKNGTTIVGSSLGSLPDAGVETATVVGGPTSLGGTSFSEAEIEAATFGAAIFPFGGDPGTLTTSIEAVRVKVYYTSSGPPWEPEEDSNYKIRVVSSGARWR